MKNIGVILASGSGQRMGAHIPKQFLRVAGREIVDYTIEAFNVSEDIDEIIVMTHPDYVEKMKGISSKYNKVKLVMPGGETRNETSELAIRSVEEECNLIFHDAVRPFVSRRIIKDTVEALKSYSTVDVAIESADTIIEVNNQDIIKSIPNRDTLRRGQTPQGFRKSTIERAYNLAKKDATFSATDDCGVVIKYLPDEPVYVVKGSENNIKITHTLDLAMADKLFQINYAVTHNIDSKECTQLLKDKVLVVFGGSYGIGSEIIEMAQTYGARCFAFSRSASGTDICDESSVKEALESVEKEAGRIDYIVNTAGRLDISPLEETDISTIREMIEVNFTAVAILASYAKPILEKSGGQLLLFTSSSYTRGRENYSLYSASKAAIVNMTQALSEEWGNKVRINCINPARTATPMRTKAFGAEDPATLLSSAEVANISVNTLISDFTGQVIDVTKDM